MAEFTVEKPGEYPVKYPRFAKSTYGGLWVQASSAADWVCFLSRDQEANFAQIGKRTGPSIFSASEILPPGTKITITV